MRMTPASGDLRNVIRTVNELPEDYAGELTLMLNDREPRTVIRNILLLIILGTVDSDAQAAEVALHAWYSAFIRLSHEHRLHQAILQLVKHAEKDRFTVDLGSRSQLITVISSSTGGMLSEIVATNIPIAVANKEIRRVR